MPQTYRFSVQYHGQYKSGKSDCICSWAQSGLLKLIQTDPNVAAADKYKAAGYPIELIDMVGAKPIEAYQHFKRKLLPEIYNRKWDCSAIALDSYAFLYDGLVAEQPAFSEKHAAIWWRKLKNDAKADLIQFTC